ncbi:MarR family winged helix-turn-helix transcriptional regulator [Maritalea sp.]|uniref:MarR family winged helix-turn-helix transcriptional regulator n=1 Tax=Maritalea sp. TaxID=2003361 RepID=UPI003EFB2B54
MSEKSSIWQSEKDSLLAIDKIPVHSSLLSVAGQRLARLLKSQISTLLSNNSKLGLVEWRICLCISQRENPTQKDLVDFAGMEQGQISRALMKLEDRGLIISRQAQFDRRARIFALSDAGQASFDRVQPIVTNYHASIDAALSPQEREQFLEMAERIANASLLANQELSQKAG